MTNRAKRRSRSALAVAAALTLTGGPLAGQQSAPHGEHAGAVVSCPAPPAGLEAPMATVRYLADDALEGRLAGSPGEACAADYIARAFEALGLRPAGEDGYFQHVRVASAVNPHAPAAEGRNVLALLPGADPELRGSAVVVGAHYDHLGHGEFGSTGEPGEIHNGADDNASGVAALLEAARLLASGPAPARSVLFIAFTGEELGLIGSAHYAGNPAVPLAHTVAMLNLDMVGRLEDDALIVYGMGTAPEWQEIVPAANAELAIPLAFEESGFGPSDHTSFYVHEVPVLHLFTNAHADYHRDTDDWEKIDAAGLERVARLTANVARAVAERPARLTVIPGVGQREQRAGGYGAWLGTVPDFTPVEEGVLLSGVTAGSPADEAGLRKGDILVGLGTHEVTDLEAFTAALRAHKPGDVVALRYLREGETRETTARLGDRADRSP